MNRLQKKCFIATVGLHLLLVVILLVGPAFFYSKPKPDDSQVLDVIPAMAIDQALSSGVKAAQPPPPQPQIPIVDPPPPIQPQPQPQPTPTPPQPEPKPSIVKQVEDFFEPTPAPNPDLKVVEKPEKPKTHEVKVSLTPVVRNVPKNDSAQKAQAEQQRAERQAERQAQAWQKAVSSAARSLSKNFAPSTSVEMPGTSSVSYANYASIIKSIYTHAWETPDNAANDEANTKVSVTVSSEGNVIESHIIGASGDSAVDASVQRTLDRVNFIAPFPDGASEKQKTFIINFNLKAKRMLG